MSNLFTALRAAFPADLSATAVETTTADGTPLLYTWDDLDRASARIANLLASLSLPEGSRVAVQVEKSVEAIPVQRRQQYGGLCLGAARKVQYALAVFEFG